MKLRKGIYEKVQTCWQTRSSLSYGWVSWHQTLCKFLTLGWDKKKIQCSACSHTRRCFETGTVKYERKVVSEGYDLPNTRNICVCTVQKTLELACVAGRRMTVQWTSQCVFLVIAVEPYFVNQDTRACTYQEWENMGYPCAHSCTAILSTGRNIENYAGTFYIEGWYKLVYDKSITVPTLPDLNIPAASGGDLPPVSRRVPGRPKKKSMQERNVQSRRMTCTRCGTVGHNHRTCREPTILAGSSGALNYIPIDSNVIWFHSVCHRSPRDCP